MLRECIVCYAVAIGDIICDSCVFNIKRYIGKCSMCFDRQCYCNDEYIGLFTYDSVKDMILRLKYCSEDRIANVFAQLSDIEIEDGLLWTCVPTTYKKLAQRGYNASLVLCSVFAKKYNGYVSPFMFDMCETDVVKENDKLSRLVKNERFTINENLVKNLPYKKLVIVDDVICTGGTIAKLISLFRLHSDIPVISICMAKK